jgi:hemolysin-activating ACP:hemolysin acyltransferase
MASPTQRGSADQSETPVGGPARAGNGDAAGAMSQPPAANQPQQVTASSDAAGAPARTATVRQIDLALGQIVAVLMRSPQHKHYSLADLEWLVLPAVLSGQYRIAQAQQQAAVAPVGVVLWARVSAEVDRRLSDLSTPARLRPDEWRSGDIPWLLELVCDTRAQQALLKELGETVFKGRSVKMRVRGADGKVQVGTLQGAARNP